jgi:hypothetical protein
VSLGNAVPMFRADYHCSTSEVLIDWDDCSVTVLATRTGCGGCVIAASCPIVRDECETADHDDHVVVIAQIDFDE